jgi:hypothetical protein
MKYNINVKIEISFLTNAIVYIFKCFNGSKHVAVKMTKNKSILTVVTY